MAYCLVTPASRGIGHALTKHLLTTTKVPVVATTRKDTDGVKSGILNELKDVDPSRLTVLELDVTGTVPVLSCALLCLSPDNGGVVYNEDNANEMNRGGEC